MTDKKIDPGQMSLFGRLLILQIKGLDFRSRHQIMLNVFDLQLESHSNFVALKVKTKR